VQSSTYEQSQPWVNFVMGCSRSPQTAKNYIKAVKHYMAFIDVKDPSQLLQGNSEQWESLILSYIQWHVKEGLSSHIVKHRLNAIIKFYRRNRVKIDGDYLRESIPETKDRGDEPYKREQILQALETAGHRERVAILMVASCGARDAALPTLTRHDLVPIDKYGIYRITIYKGYKEEYITFCTPECRKAIDDYFAYRQRAGEELKEKTPLFRDEFDPNDPLRAAHPKLIETTTIAKAVIRIMERAGVRKRIAVIEGQNPGRLRHPVKAVYGLRKYFETQSSLAGVNLAWVDMLMGHDIGIKRHYHKPTEEELLEGNDRMRGYIAAVDYLTINEANRLEKQVDNLKKELEGSAPKNVVADLLMANKVLLDRQEQLQKDIESKDRKNELFRDEIMAAIRDKVKKGETAPADM